MGLGPLFLKSSADVILSRVCFAFKARLRWGERKTFQFFFFFTGYNGVEREGKKRERTVNDPQQTPKSIFQVSKWGEREKRFLFLSIEQKSFASVSIHFVIPLGKKVHFLFAADPSIIFSLSHHEF